jgi:thymidine kinase
MSQTDRVIDHFLDGTGCGVMFVGEMFGNKTGALAALYLEMLKFSRINQISHGDRIYLFFKPKDDKRYSSCSENITNNDQTLKIPAIEIDRAEPEKILAIVSKTVEQGGKIGAIFIDEAWSFADGLVKIYEQLVRMNHIVVLTCINKFFDGEPIPTTGALLCLSDYIIVKQAICIPCAKSGRTNNRARYSFKIDEIWKYEEHSAVQSEDKVEFGGSAKYFAACRQCFCKLYRLIEERKEPRQIALEMGILEHLASKGIIL